MILGNIIQEGTHLFTDSQQFVCQWGENISLSVSMDGTFDGYSFAWVVAYDRAMMKTDYLTYDEKTHLLTIPAKALKKAGHIYVTLRAMKGEETIPCSPVGFLIKPSGNPNAGNSPHEPGWEEIAKGLFEQIFSNEYKQPLDDLFEKADEAAQAAITAGNNANAAANAANIATTNANTAAQVANLAKVNADSAAASANTAANAALSAKNAANTAAQATNTATANANDAAQAANEITAEINRKLQAGELKGDPGSRTLYGSGAPINEIGNTGDWYYDTASEFWDVYHKESQDKWTKMGQIKSSFDGNVLIGVIHEYAGSEAPTGYLLCQGQEISRTTYADLFQVIGTTYGSGDGSTTFHIPDMRGRVAVGLHSSDSDFDTMGKQGGSKTHALTVEEMPSHTHAQNAHKHTASGSSGEAGAHGHSASSNSTGAHTHTVSGTATSGGSHAHNTWKVWSTKYTYGTYDIIMTGAPADGRGNPTESAGAHTHTVSGTAASAGSHSHTITVNSGGAHTHTVSVTVNNATAVNQLTGGGLAHNNMQPYIVLNYIIKY